MDLLIGLGILLIVVIIIGALIGGKYLGDTIRKGCGCLVLLLIILIGVFIYSIWETKSDHAYFTVKQNCETYTKPNINSEISGYLEAGQELYVEDMNKFNYFYEVIEDNGRKIYILKDNLRIKKE